MLTEPGLHVDANADRTATVRLSGEISAVNLATVRRAFETAAGSGPLIVDLSEVSCLDGAGVELLFEVAAERGLEVVLGPGSVVFPVVRVSGLDRVATIR
jgi:anti-anti-sigma regulatory factor